ncbi:Tetratricopeptide repeat-containing protein [Ekhidna lutea]|uniref:Tetratricopeptide repeat-containing protein n=1 Tax=Ekhidna lutea TaxID=447679 RepID=A0A239GY35_EKHLU|nr:tetratricopeptide repeat protein [Ekhidna lutea]SNS73831.1 Tetratricopeptide repeat-containing protein [Ekhidna lutea]
MRTLLTLLLAAICVVGYSQKKPKINQAMSAMEDGELAEAKSIIDAAIEHEKTKDDPETWYFRGQIYAALDTANNEEGALEESLKAFDKAIELDPEQKKISSFTGVGIENVDTKRQGYYAYYYNQAIADYNAESFETAADNFETAYFINPTDTNAILNAAYAAVAGGDTKRAEENFKKSYDAGVRDKTVFLQLYNYAVKDERMEEALDVIRKGKEAYPDDIDFAKYEINLLIQLEKTEDAKAELEKAIEADPQNADLLFSLGVLKEELGDKEGALKSYRDALEVDPDHYNSNFNLGVAVFNEANELIKERNALSYKEEKKSNELTKKINVELEKALPIWEKLYSLNSSDQTVLETLGYIYNSLGMKDKYNKIQDELDAMGGN